MQQKFRVDTAADVLCPFTHTKLLEYALRSLVFGPLPPPLFVAPPPPPSRLVQQSKNNLRRVQTCDKRANYYFKETKMGFLQSIINRIKAWLGFLGTGDITYEEEFRFNF